MYSGAEVSEQCDGFGQLGVEAALGSGSNGLTSILQLAPANGPRCLDALVTRDVDKVCVECVDVLLDLSCCRATLNDRCNDVVAWVLWLRHCC